MLLASCGGRLSPVQWFRSDWQRGGGSTGFARYEADAGPVEVVVKLPVGPVEYRWTTALGRDAREHPADHDCPTPRVFAAGTTLNGYDLGWIVMERLAGDPLGEHHCKEHVQEILRACARWHARSQAVEAPAGSVPKVDWERMIGRSREVAKRGSIERAQHWNNRLKDVSRALDLIITRWNARTINAWCHGDLHPGNAMRRDHGPCVLLDLALVHPGHWLEDSLYLERVYWGHPDHLHGINPITALAAARRELGLDASDNYGLLASVRRVLTAACAPGLLEREGNKRYLAYALETIEKLLPMVAH